MLTPEIHLLTSPKWVDYELIDSGYGQKLERFGAYTFIRPEVQALWKPASPDKWENADAKFESTGEESGGHWITKKKIPDKWNMQYKKIQFYVMTTHGRHLGVFPECAAHWDWMMSVLSEKNQRFSKKLSVLNLFGYTGLATLACASQGVHVTHLDASRKSVEWARDNQRLSGLQENHIRWIVDDAYKFVEREGRRGVKYDALILDPPKFGRGPKGEIWDLYKSLPLLLNACRKIISDTPLFMVLTIYAVKFSALHASSVLGEMTKSMGGTLECGELITEEQSAGRLLSQAVYARWKGL